MIYMFFIGYIIGGIAGAFILACILLANKMCVVIKEKNKDEEIEVLTKANENLKVLYQDIVTQGEWHDEYYKKEIERLTKQSNDYAKRIIKAIEYIDNVIDAIGLGGYDNLVDIKDILKGVDKEWNT